MWREEYRVGVNIIDIQHRQLFESVGTLLEAVREDDPIMGAQEAINTLDFLHNYFVEHFSTEEAHMLASNSPGFEEHRKMHADFIEAVTYAENRIYDSAFNMASIRLLSRLLVSWLENHVTGVDKMMVLDSSVSKAILERQTSILSKINEFAPDSPHP